VALQLSLVSPGLDPSRLSSRSRERVEFNYRRIIVRRRQNDYDFRGRVDDLDDAIAGGVSVTPTATYRGFIAKERTGGRANRVD
jgi:hypothetical protein